MLFFCFLSHGSCMVGGLPGIYRCTFCLDHFSCFTISQTQSQGSDFYSLDVIHVQKVIHGMLNLETASSPTLDHVLAREIVTLRAWYIFFEGNLKSCLKVCVYIGRAHV